MKKLPIIIFVILLSISFCGCKKDNPDQKIIDNKDNILMVDVNNTIGDSFKDLFEVTQDINLKSEKRYKFIILSESEAEKIKTITDTKTLKEKVFEGHYIIYPQTSKEKLDKFVNLFYKHIEFDNNYVCGLVLKREMNFITQSYFVLTIPNFSTSKETSTTEYVKSEIKSVIKLDEPNKDKEIFLGLYIRKTIYVGTEFKEMYPFDSKTIYDEFDTYRNNNLKKFSYFYDTNKQEVIYSIKYEINKETFEYFMPYLVVKGFDGNIKSLPFRNSTYVHEGITYTMTEKIPIYSGVYSIPEFYKQEYLQITFDFV